MDKRAEIREGIALELCLYCQQHDESAACGTLESGKIPCQAALATAQTIMSDLSNKGVVFKVEEGVMSKELFCPFASSGCETKTHICMFWKNRLGCELDVLIHDIRGIPNLLRHIEEQLKEGKQLKLRG